MNLHLFDIDGTLCNESEQIDKSTLMTLEKLLRKDHIIVNTGRGYPSIVEAFQNNKKILKQIECVCENGSKLLLKKKNGSYIFPLSQQTLKEFIQQMKMLGIGYQYFDFRLDNVLYTYSQVGKIGEDEKYRIYYDSSLDLLDYLQTNQSKVTMVYVKKGEDEEQIIIQKGTNKALIFNYYNMKQYDKIYVYGNGNNDISIFQYSYPNKVNIGIGNNKKIQQLADTLLVNRQELNRYLNGTFNL